MNSTCAGPPTRNQVSSASDWLASNRPRNAGIADLSAAVMSGKLMRARIASSGPRQFTGQRVGPLGDRSGAEAHHVVARTHPAAHERGEIRRLVERHHVAMP